MVLFILLLSPWIAQSAVFIHFAYTDHETSGVLKTTLNDNRKGEVLAIGVNTVNNQMVFGESITHYIKPQSLSAKPIITDTSSAKHLKRSLIEELNKSEVGSAPIESLYMPGARSLSNASKKFEVLSLRPQEKNTNDDITLVIQSPEYGRQPKLMERYLDSILKAAADLPQADKKLGGLHIASFGTAGGVSSKFNPGEVAKVTSSLFVGVEVVPGSTPPRYKGRIAFASKEPGESLSEIYSSNEYKSLREAEANVSDVFLKLVNPKENETTSGKICASCTQPGMDSSGSQELWAVLSEKLLARVKKSENTSLTVSFFGSEDVKKAAAELGLTNVNMEDFHLISAINRSSDKLKEKGLSDIRRVVLDPAEISKSAKSNLKKWLESSTYSEDKYVDAILWGLKGKATNNIPNSARWDVFKNLPLPEQKKLLAGVPFKDNQNGPVDPFFNGIAETFISSIKSPHYLMALLGPVTNVSPSELNSKIQKKSLEVSAMVNELTKSQHMTDAQLRKSIRSILDAVKSVEVRKVDGNAVRLPIMAANEPDGGQLKVVNLTHDVFGKNGTTTKELANQLDYNKLDRAFYRISLTALDSLATEKITLEQAAASSKAAKAQLNNK